MKITLLLNFYNSIISWVFINSLTIKKLEWPTKAWIDTVKNGKDIPLADSSWFDILTNFNLFTHFVIQYWCFVPEISIFICIIVVILKKEWDTRLLLKFTIVLFHLATIFCFCTFIIFPPFVRFFFNNLCFVDSYLLMVKLIIFLISQFFLLIIYYRFFDKRAVAYEKLSEKSNYKAVYLVYLAFILLSLLFTSVNDFFGFYIILEGLSFAFIFNCVLNFNKTSHALVSIRYFVYNLFVSGGLLLGIAALYGLFGTTSFFYCKSILAGDAVAPVSFSNSLLSLNIAHPRTLVLFVVLFFFGCFFKLGCYPFNTWLLGINQFISYEVFFFFNIIFKNLFFFVFFRICTYWLADLASYWSPLLLFFGYCSVVTGTLGAFGQKRIKSFLTFSSVVQIGYSFIGISFVTVPSFASVFFLHFMYLFSNIIIAGIILYLSCDSRALASSRWRVRNVFYSLSDLHMLRKINPILAVVVTLAILSMAGLPPTLGFFAKFYYYEIIIECGMAPLCVVLLILNAFSLYYYINIIKNIWLFDTDMENFVYFPVFNREWFMIVSLSLFSIMNVFAIFLHKFVLLLCSKLSLYGSRVVFAQVYKFIMRHSDTRFFYKQMITLRNSDAELYGWFWDVRMFTNDCLLLNEDSEIYHTKSAVFNDAIARDTMGNYLVSQEFYPSYFRALYNTSDYEWTAYGVDQFLWFQGLFTMFILLTIWSFYMIYIKGFARAINIITAEEFNSKATQDFIRSIVFDLCGPLLIVTLIAVLFL